MGVIDCGGAATEPRPLKAALREKNGLLKAVSSQTVTKMDLGLNRGLPTPV